jgi:hypothetical protein
MGMQEPSQVWDIRSSRRDKRADSAGRSPSLLCWLLQKAGRRSPRLYDDAALAQAAHKLLAPALRGRAILGAGKEIPMSQIALAVGTIPARRLERPVAHRSAHRASSVFMDRLPLVRRRHVAFVPFPSRFSSELRGCSDQTAADTFDQARDWLGRHARSADHGVDYHGVKGGGRNDSDRSRRGSGLGECMSDPGAIASPPQLRSNVLRGNGPLHVHRLYRHEHSYPAGARPASGVAAPVAALTPGGLIRACCSSQQQPHTPAPTTFGERRDFGTGSRRSPSGAPNLLF